MGSNMCQEACSTKDGLDLRDAGYFNSVAEETAEEPLAFQYDVSPSMPLHMKGGNADVKEVHSHGLSNVPSLERCSGTGKAVTTTLGGRALPRISHGPRSYKVGGHDGKEASAEKEEKCPPVDMACLPSPSPGRGAAEPRKPQQMIFEERSAKNLSSQLVQQVSHLSESSPIGSPRSSAALVDVDRLEAEVATLNGELTEAVRQLRLARQDPKTPAWVELADDLVE